MDMEFNKVQIYMALTQEEHDKALEWIVDRLNKDDFDHTEIREVGKMPTTDLFGNPIDAFIFVFTAPSKIMVELTDYMKTDAVMI